MVKHVVKSLFKAILKGSIVPKKPMFTRVFSVFRDFIMRGRCLAPKASALPIAPHLDFIWNGYIIADFCGKVKPFEKFFCNVGRSVWLLPFLFALVLFPAFFFGFIGVENA